MDLHSVLLFHGFSICSMVPNPVSWILILFHGCSLCSMDLHAVPWILIVLWSLILFLNCHSVSWIYTLFHGSTLSHGLLPCSTDSHSVPWSHTLLHGSSLCSMISHFVLWFLTTVLISNQSSKSSLRYVVLHQLYLHQQRGQVRAKLHLRCSSCLRKYKTSNYKVPRVRLSKIQPQCNISAILSCSPSVPIQTNTNPKKTSLPFVNTLH